MLFATGMMAQGATASIAAHPIPLCSISSSCLSLQPKSFLPWRDQSCCVRSWFHLSLATSQTCVAFPKRDRSLASPRCSTYLSSVFLAPARRCSRFSTGALPIWKVGTESNPICRSERRNAISQTQDCAELDTSIHEVLDSDFFLWSLVTCVVYLAILRLWCQFLETTYRVVMTSY